MRCSSPKRALQLESGCLLGVQMVSHSPNGTAIPPQHARSGTHCFTRLLQDDNAAFRDTQLAATKKKSSVLTQSVQLFETCQSGSTQRQQQRQPEAGARSQRTARATALPQYTVKLKSAAFDSEEMTAARHVRCCYASVLLLQICVSCLLYNRCVTGETYSTSQ